MEEKPKFELGTEPKKEHKHEITAENVGNFISGNWRMFLDKVGAGKEHIAEQVAYRKHKCPDCYEAGHCLGSCGCSVPGRWYVTKTCNNNRFPDLMDAETWKQFKSQENIQVIYEDTKK